MGNSLLEVGIYIYIYTIKFAHEVDGYMEGFGPPTWKEEVDVNVNVNYGWGMLILTSYSKFMCM